MNFLMGFLAFLCLGVVLGGIYLFKKRWQALQAHQAFRQTLFAETFALENLEARPSLPSAKLSSRKSMSEAERFQRFMEKN